MKGKRTVYEIKREIQNYNEQLQKLYSENVEFALANDSEGITRNKKDIDPYVELYHYESKSRGAEDNKEKIRRFQTEIEFMRCRWEKLLKEGDPYYNKNLSLAKWNYSLRPKD